jgi:acyl-CoA synthetase (AMP-forming)/AMP-acid ligase II
MHMPPRPELLYRPTIGEAIRRAADLWGDHDFVVLPTERMTYRQAEQRSRSLARRMLAAGIGKGSRVGVFYTYSTEFVITWLAAVRVGAVVMPFSSIYAPAELRAVLRIGDVQLLLAGSTMLGKDHLSFLEEVVPGLEACEGPRLLLPSLPYLRSIWLTDPTDRAWARTVDLTDEGPTEVSDELFEQIEADVSPADWAQVTYTSGSSALPKGVIHTHGAILRQTSPEAIAVGKRPLAFDADTSIFCGFPFFWIGGTLVLGLALQTGAKICVIPRFKPDDALAMCDQQRCDVVLAWPSLVQSMRAHPDFAKYDFSRVPSLADPTTVALTDAPRPGVPLHRGMSETVGVWPGVQRMVVNPEEGTALPEDIDGELLIRGWGVMQGYYKKEREDVFDADGWLHTGDRVFLHDTDPYFVGRYYEMIKSRGANVSPREVEVHLEGYPEIAHALVFGLPHPDYEEEVTAVVVPVAGASITAEVIQTRMIGEVSSFKVPTRIEIWDVESQIPWLGSGKPDKLRIRDMVAHPSRPVPVLDS